MKRNAGSVLLGIALSLSSALSRAAEEPSYTPDVMAYNLRLGSQAFGAQYQFTTNPITVEAAGHLLKMGSDIVKFSLSNKPTKTERYDTLVEALEKHFAYRQLLSMPFRHYFFWAGSAVPRGEWWKKGPDAELEKQTHDEMYTLTAYLLKRFNESGKRFYFGNWEGDWLLIGSGSHAEKRNPDPARILGMRAWLNARQKGIDDAKRDTPHSNVDVFFYIEVNRVRDAMRPKSEFTNRVVNTILPHIKDLDFVSYSSYDAQNLDNDTFCKTMNFIESHISTNKAASINGKRIFIGEYGFGTLTPAQQVEPTRNYMLRALKWGVPFMLYWQVFNNEDDHYFSLVDPASQYTPLFYLHADYLKTARKRIALFKANAGRLPTEEEFSALAVRLLEQHGGQQQN